VELNFVLLSSRTKEPGLEVECKGEVVRLENLANGDSQAALAVRISDYRLLPLLASRSNLEDPFKKPEGQN
jgi:hypothetical protein